MKPNVTVKRLRELIALRPNTPPGKSGDVEVAVSEIPAGELTPVVSMRNAFFMGLKPMSISFDVPLPIRKLTYEGGTWMTDQPCELWQMDWATKQLKGRVLIGGLGLGLANVFALENRHVIDTITVEKDPNVISLVAGNGAAKRFGTVIETDLFNYLKSLKPGRFDSAFFDIWQSTGEFTWTGQVVPLRRLARGKIKNLICWLEEEMQNQVRQALPHFCALEGYEIAPHYQTFVDAIDAAGIKRVTVPKTDDPIGPLATQGLWDAEQLNTSNPALQKLMDLFLTTVGTDQWERTFSDLWDKNFAKETKP